MQETGEVDYFPMRSAHGPQAMAIGQKFSNSRIDRAFIIALVFDNLHCADFIGFQNQRRRLGGDGMIERVCDFLKPIE